MEPFLFAMPGALRLRTLQPLIDEDGACSLVYDVERAAVFEVPEELRLYVAPTLETGNLDEELLGWLASEDLLTAESCPEWSAHQRGWPAVAELSGQACEVVHGWIDQTAAGPALEAVDRVFRRGMACSRIHLHLDRVGTLPADGLVERVVAEGRRRAALSGQEVSFELTLDPDQITAAVARGLAAHRVRVRLRCGECDPLKWLGTPREDRPWLHAEAAVEMLIAQSEQRRPGRSPEESGAVREAEDGQEPLAAGLSMEPREAVEARKSTEAPESREARKSKEAPESREALESRETREPEEGHEPEDGRLQTLTVQCLLDGAARLIELWRWAAATGVRSLDAIRLDESVADAAVRRGGGRAPAARVRDYRRDLLAICEETCAELEAGRLPIDFQPLTRIVRRLMRGEVPGAMEVADDEMVVSENGRPFPGVEGLDPRLLPELIWQRLEEPPNDGRSLGSLCRACWARRACSHSAYVASPLGKEDPREPTRERCAFWLAEVETAVRLYHRLAQIDAIQVRRFFECEAPMQPAARPQGDPERPASKPS
jgi:hypothetical protein